MLEKAALQFEFDKDPRKVSIKREDSKYKSNF